VRFRPSPTSVLYEWAVSPLNSNIFDVDVVVVFLFTVSARRSITLIISMFRADRDTAADTMDVVRVVRRPANQIYYTTTLKKIYIYLRPFSFTAVFQYLAMTFDF